MADKAEEILKPKRNVLLKILITQAICMLLLVAAVAALKYILPQEFKEAKEWYIENILDETTADYVLDGAKIDEI